MEFGVQFFPAVGPDQKPADQYWREALELTQLAEQLGFTNVRTVEHYFLSYGGFSTPPPLFFFAPPAGGGPPLVGGGAGGAGVFFSPPNPPPARGGGGGFFRAPAGGV